MTSHLAPSLEPATWLASHGLSRWLDFGSGGGFPAIPLAICGVGESWDLVESRRTKTLFLRRAVEQLGLENIRVFAERLENLVTVEVSKAIPGGNNSSQSLELPYDGFTSRATLALGPTLALAAHVVRPGGFAFLWKGSRLEGELAGLGNVAHEWKEIERRTLSNGMSAIVKFERVNS